MLRWLVENDQDHGYKDWELEDMVWHAWSELSRWSCIHYAWNGEAPVIRQANVREMKSMTILTHFSDTFSHHIGERESHYCCCRLEIWTD